MNIKFVVPLIVLILISSLFFFYKDSTVQNSNDTIQLIKTHSVLAEVGDVSYRNNENDTSCPPKENLRKELASTLVARNEKIKSLIAVIKSSDLSRPMASFILQSVGMNQIEFNKGRYKPVSGVNILTVTDGDAPILISGDSELKLARVVSTHNLIAAAKLINVNKYPTNAIINGQTVLSYVLSSNNNHSPLELVEFIISSNRVVLFSDFVDAIKYGQHLDVLRALADSYTGDLKKEWVESHSIFNLAVFSAKYGRPDLIEFLAERGVPLIVEKHGRIENSVLDMYSSFNKDILLAVEVLKISGKYKVMPAGFNSYVFFEKIHNPDDVQLAEYIDMIKLNFSSKFNFINIPKSIQIILDAVKVDSNAINSMHVKLNSCFKEERISVASKFEREEHKVENELSSVEFDEVSSDEYEVNNIYNMVAEGQSILLSKNFENYVAFIFEKTAGLDRELTSHLLNLSLVKLIGANAPPKYIDRILMRGARMTPAMLNYMALKNQSDAISFFSKKYVIDKLEQSQKDVLIQRYNDGLLNKETFDSLKLMGYL